MQKLLTRHLPIVIAGILFLILVVTSFFIAPRPVLSQSGSVAITGYLWSDTIGWIDLNCANSGVCGSNPFGLSIDQSGNITGYAWSDNIGWISANPSDLSGCPSAPCTATVSGTTVSGWLRALSGNTSQSGGWDGFISLNGSGYGVTLNAGTFSGYAWGDINTGWVSFAQAVTNYGKCTAAYTCGGPGGQTITYTNTSCQQTAGATCTLPSSFCSNGSSVCLIPVITVVPGTGSNASSTFATTGHLQIFPLLLQKGETSQVYWDVINATSCTVTGTNGDRWTGLTSGNAGQKTSSISAQVTYTLSCSGYAGATPPSLNESVSVNISPQFQER